MTPSHIESLRNACSDFTQLGTFEAHEEVVRYNEVIASIHRISASLRTCELHGVPRDELLTILGDVRRIHRQSPFLRRIQDWPRGYQGDFDTIELLCDAKNTAPYGTLGYLCERFALHCSAAQQHRNKVRHQGDLIAKALRQRQAAHEKPARILLLASGGARDVLAVLDEIAGYTGEIVGVDIDQGATDLAKQRLQVLGDRCRMLQGNVFPVLRSMTDRFDLILAGGLFDYLEDNHAGLLVRMCLTRLLEPAGKLFFTNIAWGNPFRLWMEYMVDWRLIERSEQDVRHFLTQVGVLGDNITITRDLTELTLLVEVQAGPLGPAVEGSATPMSRIACPHCLDLPMLERQIRATTIDVCPVCNGCWLDAGELEALSTNLVPPPALHDIRTSDRHCPRCKIALHSGMYPNADNLELDRCDQCGGLWFDQGELALVMRRAMESADAKATVEST